MTASPGPGSVPHLPTMLAGTADRERAIDVLKAGLAEGRLSQDEHDARVARLSAARTHADLAQVVADLPAGQGFAQCYPDDGYPRAAAPVRLVNSAAVVSLVCGLAEVPTLGLSALPAVILGARARQQIRETGERGEGLAVAGLVLGWIALSIFFAAILGIMIWLVLPPGPGTGGPIGS